ncbi:MAG: hypothetical protein ACK5LE_02985 [Alphaproteobacteria bacterium]
MFLSSHLRKSIIFFISLWALYIWPLAYACDYLQGDSGFTSCLDDNIISESSINQPPKAALPKIEPPISLHISGDIELHNAATHIRVKKKGD